MKKEIVLSSGTWLFIEAPHAMFRVIEGKLQWVIPHLIWASNEPSHEEYEEGEIELPEGKWNFHSSSCNITEDQAGEIVEEHEYMGYVDYVMGDAGELPADLSLKSLLKSHDLLAQNYAILKLI